MMNSLQSYEKTKRPTRKVLSGKASGKEVKCQVNRLVKSRARIASLCPQESSLLYVQKLAESCGYPLHPVVGLPLFHQFGVVGPPFERLVEERLADVLHRAGPGILDEGL